MNRFGKLMFVALMGMIIFVPLHAAGQNEFFSIADFNERGTIEDPHFSLNPNSGTLVLVYTLKLGNSLPRIAVSAAKIGKNGYLKFRRAVMISDSNRGSVVPAITFHPDLQTFLIMWHSFSDQDNRTVISLGGRLLNKKGKPLKTSLQIDLNYNLLFPHPIAWNGNSEVAPEGARYFVTWVSRTDLTRVIGQWFDQNLLELGSPIEMSTFNNVSLSISDSLLVGDNTGIFVLEENYIDSSSSENRYVLHLLRYYLDGSKSFNQIVFKKADSIGLENASLIAVSPKNVILGTTPGLNLGARSAENYTVKNAGNLHASKSSIKVFPGAGATSQNIVQLEDGRIFQVILTDLGHVVIQQLNAKGKPSGAPFAQIIPPFNAQYSTSQAVVLPGGGDILIALCDNSGPKLSVKGLIVTIE